MNLRFAELTLRHLALVVLILAVGPGPLGSAAAGRISLPGITISEASNNFRPPEKNVPGDAWDRYLDGDRGVFARRIVRSRDQFSLEAIRTNYEDDDGFREHVDSYFVQFQEVLAQVEKNYPEDILAAVLLPSDVGKLYLLVSKALGRLN
jgi:hypothetical protein